MMSSETKRKKLSRRRGTPILIRLLRWKFSFLQYFLPSLAVKQAYDLWFMTRRFDSPARELRWIKNATLEVINTSVGKIQTYQWGSGSRLILLVHGWEGRGTQLGAFVEPLLQHGYKVVSFDMPGHGRSEGKNSNIFLVSQVLLELQQRFSSPYAIIAHSFGSTAVSYTLNHGLKTRRLVSIGAPLNFPWMLERFSSYLRLRPNIVNRLQQMMENRFNLKSLDGIATDNNFARLNMPALVVHDKNDNDVPWQHAKALADSLTSAELYLTSNLGHRRILHNTKVINDIVDFVNVHSTTTKLAEIG